MKKIYLSLCITLFAITIIFALSACSNETPNCQHQWLNADCVYPKTCRLCGETEGEALGHSWEEATCTNPKTCSRCQKTEGEALGHTEVVDEGREPTCTTSGLTEGVHCSTCGKTIVEQNSIPSTSHSFSSSYSKDKTNHWYECSCGEKKDIAAHIWDEGVVTAEPTETKNGTTLYTCVCGQTKTEEIAMLGHVHTFAETLSYNETNHWYASTCGHDDAVTKLPHQYSWSTQFNATCEKAEILLGTCTCGHTITKSGQEALGHDYEVVYTWQGYECIITLTCKNDSNHVVSELMLVTSKVTKEASCTEEGTKVYTATFTYDGVKYTDTKTETLKELGHNYKGVVTNPTCTKDGYTTHTCDCGHSYTDSTVKALGHDYGVSYIWNEYKCTLTLTCKNNSSHVVTKTMTVTSKVIKEATPAETGSKLYTATVTYDGVVYTDTKEEILVYYTHGLKYTLSADKTYYIVSKIGTATDTEIFIPSTYNGLPVKSIGTYAFTSNTKLIGITIPNSVVNIDEYAFYGCSNLESVTLLGVTNIGDYAFKNCTALESITIPESVTSIGKFAFGGCSSLKNITIPKSVTNIGDYAFRDCTSLDNIKVDANNNVYDSRNNCNALIETASNTLIFGCKNTVIPNDITHINDYAFSSCKSLISITIPSSVISIGDYSFENCSSLDNIIIPNSVTTIGSYAFQDCSALTNITISNSVKSIGENAFADCTSLENVYIKDLASWCNIDFYNSEANPFAYAKNLYINEELTTEIFIPNGVVSINDYAFWYCSTLVHVDIPNTVKNIGDCAFRGCVLLSDLIIPDGVVSIGKEAFGYCNSITSIEIPDSVTSIGDGVFKGCQKLASANIGNGVTEFSDYMFYNCKVLAIIEFSDKITAVGDYAFYCCDLLKSIVLPATVISIGDYAFYNCDSLKSITIELGLTSIGEYAFFECNSFNSIYFSGTKEEFFAIEKGDYYNAMSAPTTVYCSDGSYFMY